MLLLRAAPAQSRARGKGRWKVVEANVFVIEGTDILRCTADRLRGVVLAAIRSSGGWKCVIHGAQVPWINR